MAEVELNSAVSPVDAIQLTIAESAGPIIELSLPANHPWKLENSLVVMGLLGARAEVRWGEQALSVRVTGFRSAAGGRDSMVGIVLPDEMLDWFERHTSDDHKTQMLVYQRQDADANAWAFVRRVLGNRFSMPHGAEALDDSLHVGTCFLRAAGSDNLSHLQRILGLLANLPTRAWGWCAFDTEPGEDPLRLLGLDAPVLELDDGWAPGDLSEIHLPHRAAGKAVGKLSRKFGKLDEATAAKLLRQLSRAGIELAADGLIDEADQLPSIPGQIGIGEITALCPRIQYDFDLRRNADDQEAKKVEFTSQLEFRPLPGSAGLVARSATLSGFFKEWDESSKKTRLAVMPDDEPWKLMGDDDSPDLETPDAEKPLISIAVTPFMSREGFAGFYVSHREKDPMIVEVRDGEVPKMVGMQQVFAEGLEKVDLVLNSKTVSISGIVKDTDQATADGVAVDGAAGIVEVFAAAHVALKQKVTVTDDSTTMDHNALVTQKAQVDGDVTIGGKTDISGDTTIAATLEVGS